MNSLKRNTVDWEIFVVKKFSPITFSNKTSTGKTFSLTYKWSKFILLSGHSDENKARQKFNRQNILPTKIPNLRYVQNMLQMHLRGLLRVQLFPR